jgi:hypothetical protein
MIMITLDGVQYLGEKEVSSKYGLSVHWFRKARYEGNTPTYYKLNDKVYYTCEDVEKYLKERIKKI